MADKIIERRAGMVELTYAVNNCSAKMEETKKAIEEIDKTLRGNGGEGLVSRVLLIEKLVAAHESSMVWGRRTVLGGFIVGLITLLYYLIRATK